MADRPEDPHAQRPAEKAVFPPLRYVPNPKLLARDLKKIVRGRLDRHSPEK